MMVIVPDALSAEINRRLDAAYAEVPDAAKDREHHYSALLSYFNNHGVVPDFSLKRNDSEGVEAGPPSGNAASTTNV